MVMSSIASPPPFAWETGPEMDISSSRFRSFLCSHTLAAINRAHLGDGVWILVRIGLPHRRSIIPRGMYLVRQKSASLCTIRRSLEVHIRCKVLDPELEISFVIVLSSLIDTFSNQQKLQHSTQQQAHTESICRAHFPVVVLSWHVVQSTNAVSIDHIAGAVLRHSLDVDVDIWSCRDWLNRRSHDCVRVDLAL